MESPEEMSKTRKYPDYCRTITFTDNNGVVRELVFPKALDLDRPKRARTTFSRDQLDRLEAEFSANQYLVGRERSQLARTLGLSETQVKVWFQNRRTKHKREKEKQEEDQDAKTESLAARSLLTSLSPAMKLATTPVAPNETSSVPAFSSPLPHVWSRPRLEPTVDRDRLPAGFSPASSHPHEDRAVLTGTSGALPPPNSSFAPHPAKASSHLKDHAFLGAATTYPLSHFGVTPHLQGGSPLPVCSPGSLFMRPMTSQTSPEGGAGFTNSALLSMDASRSDNDVQYGSLGSNAGICESWRSNPFLTACQAPFRPPVARAVPVPVWPLYPHTLTR